jgi:hypothetical protein
MRNLVERRIRIQAEPMEIPDWRQRFRRNVKRRIRDR